MNKEWSELNKQMQLQLKKKDTFDDGIHTLIKLRGILMNQLNECKKVLVARDFCAIPFLGAVGYHSKTIAYSIYHIFRIEDIVAHTMVEKNEQIFFKEDFQNKMQSPIMTTGNELVGPEIADFSKKLNIDALYEYIKAVDESTTEWLLRLKYEDLKMKYSQDDKQRIRELKCVSDSASAVWLIDYWCDKELKGLLQMPFSRHWIMHIEAALRIKAKIEETKRKHVATARKGMDPVSVCGHHCNYCFLGEWCGGCRSSYNVCSYGSLYEDGRCPNVICADEKGLDGCYDCPELENCEKGFYAPTVDEGQAAIGKAIFIHQYGKEVYTATMVNAITNGTIEEAQAFEHAAESKTALAFLEKNKV